MEARSRALVLAGAAGTRLMPTRDIEVADAIGDLSSPCALDGRTRVLFYLAALAVAMSVALPVAIVIVALLTYTSDERCRRIEERVKARLTRRFTERVKTPQREPDRQHAPCARNS